MPIFHQVPSITVPTAVTLAAKERSWLGTLIIASCRLTVSSEVSYIMQEESAKFGHDNECEVLDGSES